ncbi:hypothetical protein ABPG72_003619 [Tetrahymena utriculariae]
MNKRFEKLKSKIIKCYSQCFFSSENLKYLGQYFIEKFKNPHCSFDHKKLADELQEAIFNLQYPSYIRFNAVQLLKQCMQTSNSFLTNFVEQNIIDKFGKIALLTKKPRFDLLYFQNQYDEVYSIQFFQEILNCVQQWQTKSRYYEQIYRNLQKQNIGFILQNQQKSPSNINFQMQPGSLQNQSQKKYQKQFPQLSQGERVKLKIKLLQDALYFMYSCFVMQKMSDEISQILLVCNDLIISIDQEKEQLRMQSHCTEQINQIQKLQILLQTMNQNYTNGEPIQTYMKNFKSILAEILDIQNQEEEEQKIKQAFFEEFGPIKSENFIASLNSLNQLDSDQFQNNQKIRSFNCISNQLSNFHLSLHNLTANNLDHVKHFDKSPCYKINSSRGLSNYSSPNSPKKHQLSILGSLIEEKPPKKAPLIYGKLKSLKQDTSNKQQKQSNMYEQGTPETKCTTFYSVNESKENQSYFSSRNNSPQIFSTANPVLFQQVKTYPGNADEVMDEELPVRVTSHSHSQYSTQIQPDFSRRNNNSDFQSQQGLSQQNIQNNIPVISYNLQQDNSNQLNEYKINIPLQQHITQNKKQSNNNYFSSSSQNTNTIQNSFYIQNQTNNSKNTNSILQQTQDLQQFYQTCQQQQQTQQQNQQLYFTQQQQQHQIQMNYQKPQSLPQIFQAPQNSSFQNVTNDQKMIAQYFIAQGSQLQQQQTNYSSNNTMCSNNLQNNFFNNKNGSQVQIVNITNQNNQIGNNSILTQSMIQQQQNNPSLQNNKQLSLFTSGSDYSNFNSQFNNQKNSVPNTPPKVPQAIPSQSNSIANSNMQTNQTNITQIQNTNQSSLNQLKNVFGVPNSPNSQKQISKSIINLLSQQQSSVKNQNQINSNTFINSYGMNNNGQFEQQINNTNGITLMCSNNNSLNNNTNSHQINIGINQSTINLAQTVMQHLQNNQNTGLINNNSNYYSKYFGAKNQEDQQYSQQQQQQQQQQLLQMNSQKQTQKNIEISLPNQAKPLNSQIVTKINQVIPNLQNKISNDGSSKTLQQSSDKQITKIQKPSACQNLILNQQQSSQQTQQCYINSSNLGSPSKITSAKNSLNSSTNRLSQPVLIQPSTNQRFNRQYQMNPSFLSAFAKTVNNTQNASLNSSFKNQSLNTSSSQKSNTILPRNQYAVNLQRISQNQYQNN